MALSVRPKQHGQAMLWLGLHLPHLPLEIFARGGAANEPLAVTHGQGTGQRILSCSPPARKLGLHAGMGLSAAYALAGNLRTFARDKAAETAALERLATWAGQFTPMVSLAPPQGLLLEVGGSLLLFGNVNTLLRKVDAGLTDLGYRAVAAVAPTPLGALLLARAGRVLQITAKDTLAAELARLPLHCLELSADTLTTLEGMGLRSVRDCLGLPRDGLAHRVGPALPATLDRALGRVPDPRRPYLPPARFDSRLPLPAEVDTTTALAFAIHRLILELAGSLRARGGGVQTLLLRLFHRDCPVTRVTLGLATPSRDPRHLLGLMQTRLERLRLPRPVHEIGLTADEILELAPANLEFFPAPDQEIRDGAALLERLCARLGKGAVRGIRLVPEHRPERAWCYCPANESGPTTAFGPRPLWLLPEPVLLESAAGRLYLNGCLTLEHERERIENGWWDGHPVARDYFIARNPEGARLWIFRELRNRARWFLHGIFE